MKLPVIASLFALTSMVATLSMAQAPASTASVAHPAPSATASPADHVLITVIFRHDQTLNLDRINKLQEEQRFFARIPPAGVEVVSWHVAMGLGYVVVFKVPPARLRDLNRAIEQGAWGAFKTEFYPTYDVSGPVKAMQEKALQEAERNRAK